MEGHVVGAINPFTMAGTMVLVIGLILFPGRPIRRPAPVTGFRARGILWRGLGVLWVLDGLLQCQPGMFTHRFIQYNLRLNLVGQPPWARHVLIFGYELWANSPVFSNLMAVIVQLGIGVGVLWGFGRWWGRVAMALSIPWALVVWVFGEGLGGFFAAMPTYWGGAPGAAILYALAGAVALLSRSYWSSGRAMLLFRRALAVTWWIGAGLQTAALEWTRRGNANMLRGALAAPQPPWITHALGWTAGILAAQPLWSNALMVLIMTGLGLMLWRDWSHPLLWWASVGWLGLLWMGQDFAGLASGLGTDPGIVGILAVAMMAAWASLRDPAVRVINLRQEKTVPYRPAQSRAGESSPRSSGARGHV